MSGTDTKLTTRYRVQVTDRDGKITHESGGSNRKQLEGYYNSVNISGSRKVFQVRETGSNRFKTLYEQVME